MQHFGAKDKELLPAVSIFIEDTMEASMKDGWWLQQEVNRSGLVNLDLIAKCHSVALGAEGIEQVAFIAARISEAADCGFSMAWPGARR